MFFHGVLAVTNTPKFEFQLIILLLSTLLHDDVSQPLGFSFFCEELMQCFQAETQCDVIEILGFLLLILELAFIDDAAD